MGDGLQRIMPTFAAIMPNYNDGESIAAALVGLRGFDEIIVVDDGSTDHSIEVIGHLQNVVPRIRLIRNPSNIGINSCLERAMQEVKSDYVMMCSANDTYSPLIAGYCREIIKEQPHISMICGNGAHDGEHSELLPAGRIGYIGPYEFASICRRKPLNFFGAVVLRKDLITVVRALEWHLDWVLYHAVAFEHGFHYLPVPFIDIKNHAGSYNSNARNWRRQQKVNYAVIRFIAGRTKRAREDWKRAAILPVYDLRMFEWITFEECRWFITPLLIWRCLFHSAFYWVKYIAPRPLLLKLRGVFRI